MQKIKELNSKSFKALCDMYDALAPPYVPDAPLFLQMIAWKKQEAETKQIKYMTIVMTVATILNVLIALFRCKP